MTQVHDHQDLALPFPDAEEHPDGGGRPYRRLLTVREVAERLNIGRTKVFHLMAAG